MIQKFTFFFLIVIGANSMLRAQQYAGTFINTADQGLYAVQLNTDQPASLLRVETFKNPSDVANVREAIGTVYSQQYQRVFAVYENEAGIVVAHAVELSENQALEVKATFGVAFDPNYNSYFGVVLTKTDQLVAFRATY